MKRTKLLAAQPRELPADITKKEEVFAASQLVEVEGEQAVEIDLFYRGALRARYFADEKVHNAYIDGKWKTTTLNNTARICMGMDVQNGAWYYFGNGNDYVWCTAEDRKRAEDFLDKNNYMYGQGVECYEGRLSSYKTQRALNRKAERINEEMAQVPTVPEDVFSWLETDAFREEYLFFWQQGSRTRYKCTACGASSWRKKSWQHGKMAICPKCGAQVKTERERMLIDRMIPVVILQKYEREKDSRKQSDPLTFLLQTKETVWVERQFRAWCTWNKKDGKKVSMTEEIRAVIPAGGTWGKVYYGESYDTDENKQSFWDRNPANKRFLISLLYPGNLKDVLPVSGIKHSGIDRLAQEKLMFNVNNFIIGYQSRPWLEYVVKAGLYRLAADIVNEYPNYVPELICEYGQDIKGLLQINGNRVRRLKDMDGGITALDWLQYEDEMEEERIKISQESLKYLSEKKVKVSDCEEILGALGSVNRMVNYMKKQPGKPRDVAITWKDYLHMARGEGMDITDDIVRLPKDLKMRHDQLAGIINSRKIRELKEKQEEADRYRDRKIGEHLGEAERYRYSSDDYVIIPAETCAELIQEGQALHHCVGAGTMYMDKMARGETWILFLRKKETPETPYYTIEINMDNDRIIQWYSEYDRKPDREAVSKFLDKYKRIIRHRREKVAV